MFLRLNSSESCMHILFLRKYVEPHYEEVFKPVEDSDSFLVRKLKESTAFIDAGMIRLDTHHRLHRFSVLLDTNTYSIVKFEDGRLTCLNILCKTHKGAAVKDDRLTIHSNVCIHLQVFAQCK